jgi:hypothetical protein
MNRPFSGFVKWTQDASTCCCTEWQVAERAYFSEHSTEAIHSSLPNPLTSVRASATLKASSARGHSSHKEKAAGTLAAFAFLGRTQWVPANLLDEP